MNSIVFWYVTPNSMVEIYRFGERDDSIFRVDQKTEQFSFGSLLAFCLLGFDCEEAVCSSETSVNA
jgi:hypothetical protein